MLPIIIFGSRECGNALFCSFEGRPLQSVAFAFKHKPGFEECWYRIIKNSSRFYLPKRKRSPRLSSLVERRRGRLLETGEENGLSLPPFVLVTLPTLRPGIHQRGSLRQERFIWARSLKCASHHGRKWELLAAACSHPYRSGLRRRWSVTPRWLSPGSFCFQAGSQPLVQCHPHSE